MHEVLSRNKYLVKHVGKPMRSKNFDIYDPDSSSVIMECRDENSGRISNMLRAQKIPPFDLQVRTPDGQPIVRIKRGASLTFSNTTVSDQNDQKIGSFKQGFNLFGDFQILDAKGNQVCRVRSKMSGKDFRFMADKVELAHITCESAGILKEMLRPPDDYLLSISESVPPDSVVRPLSLAAVLCIEMAHREPRQR